MKIGSDCCVFFIAITVWTCASFAQDIHDAVVQGNIDMVRRIIEADGTLINRADGRGMTPLRLAVYTGNIEMMRLLLGRGAETSDLHPAIETECAVKSPSWSSAW